MHDFVFTDFEELGRAYEKARKVVENEGIPKFYVAMLVELEDFINEVKTLKVSNRKIF